MFFLIIIDKITEFIVLKFLILVKDCRILFNLVLVKDYKILFYCILEEKKHRFNSLI